MAFSGRVLVILDEIWKEVDFKSLGIPVSEKIKVIVTSQSPCVCRNMGAKIVGVNALPEEEARYLFKAVAGISDDSVLSDVAKQFAEECKEDYSIPLECLVRYGKGLELFNERDTLGDVRCRVDVLVNDLRSYHLLLDDSEREDHVKLHDVVQETCLKIASKGEHVFLVGNAREEERHQLPDSFGPYTAISLTLEGSIRLFPFGEECPRLKLLRLVFQSGKVNLSKDAFEGMEDLRVMELNNSHTEFSLSWPGQMLTSLRTLCLDYCVLDTGTSSMLGYMMQLEMLSFFKSRLQDDQFPVEIARLSNLKSLDLRVERSQQPLPHGVLSSLKKLEELYMGSPHHLRLGRDKEEERGCLEEIASLSCLECLQIHVYDLNLLFQLLHQLPIQRLLRFHIVGANYKIYRRDITREYQFRNSFELIYYRYNKRRFVFKQALDPIVSSIVKRAENLTFEGVPCLRNLVSDLDEDGFVNLRRLKLDHEVHQCLIESTTNLVARQVFENLVFMELDHVKLEEICRGNLPLPPRCFSQLQEIKLEYTNIKHLWKGPIEPPSLCSLRIVELRYCHRIETLFSQSTLKCLVKLQKLVVHQCTNLESIVMREESVNEEVLELPLLETLVMQESGLLCFDSKRETARAFLNQVSLPRLEGLQIKTYRHRPKELVGDGMHSGYLENLKYLQITDSCIGCIAKADGVTILQNLQKLVVNSHGMQLLFEFEGLKVPVLTKTELEILPKLELLKLQQSSGLTHIWRNFPRGVRVFQNLRKLIVWECKLLKFLFDPPCVANMLVSLEVLEISDCSEMYGVIGGELGEDQISQEDDAQQQDIVGKHRESSALERSNKLEFVFPKLSSLILIGLPNLLSFAGKLDAPNLEKVEVVENAIPVDLKDRKFIFLRDSAASDFYRRKRWELS
ncbi:disease resistance protein At4g27190-like [Coffea eugenioides]|uniref:disease resistance protein At4g27190-like n=1 Tax=Coffea eugenioides TaxID=49369 RepID=UPI000F61214A|nr:disease resistance protein At4g27190-like [Coffea eugenioides]